jgi:hypothetical protein
VAINRRGYEPVALFLGLYGMPVALNGRFFVYVFVCIDWRLLWW